MQTRINHPHATGPFWLANSVPTDTDMRDMVNDHGLVAINAFFSFSDSLFKPSLI
jgi:hypothetical protein